MPHNSRSKRKIKSLGTLIFESQKPVRIDVPIEQDSPLKVNRFIGFSKGVTYIKSVHGPLPVKN